MAPMDNTMLASALAGAQERATALAACPTWTVDERVRAVTLATLNELADPATALPQVMVLQQEFVLAHPDLALLAVTASHLTRRILLCPQRLRRAASQPRPRPPTLSTSR
jgi:hypothetical protein